MLHGVTTPLLPVQAADIDEYWRRGYSRCHGVRRDPVLTSREMRHPTDDYTHRRRRFAIVIR